MQTRKAARALNATPSDDVLVVLTRHLPGDEFTNRYGDPRDRYFIIEAEYAGVKVQRRVSMAGGGNRRAETRQVAWEVLYQVLGDSDVERYEILREGERTAWTKRRGTLRWLATPITS